MKYKEVIWAEEKIAIYSDYYNNFSESNRFEGFFTSKAEKNLFVKIDISGELL